MAFPQLIMNNFTKADEFSQNWCYVSYNLINFVYVSFDRDKKGIFSIDTVHLYCNDAKLCNRKIKSMRKDLIEEQLF